MRLMLTSLAFIVMVMMGQAATAEPSGLAVLPVAATGTGLFSARPGADRGPITPVQGYGCRACRRLCARDREYCDDSPRRCQRTFIRCMRICWEDYCRP